ncbi:hypothetical protein [Kitasatospora sp. NPDC057541]|uniref:hypothetical protein n=1 Tax=Kitasatospora sp. NPDC057541 TaxID=3346161 RepID=UPI0036925974
MIWGRGGPGRIPLTDGGAIRCPGLAHVTVGDRDPGRDDGDRDGARAPDAPGEPPSPAKGRRSRR